MKKLFALILTLSGLVSCIYPYNPDIEGTTDNIVVIEGTIMPGGTSTFGFSRVYPLKRTGLYDMVVGRAWVEDDEGKVYQPSSQNPATSIQIPMDDASPDRRYRMKSEIDGKTYSSDWLEPKAPPEIEDIEFSLSQDSTAVVVSATFNGGKQGTGYIGVSFEETWEFHADFRGEYYLDTLRWSVQPLQSPYPNYWCWRSNSSQMYLLSYAELTTDRLPSRPIQAFDRRDSRNHKLYSINIRAITLSEEAYKYINNLGIISTQQGSLFSPNPGEMPSNIICENDPEQRVEGYVTAGEVASKRAFLNSRFYNPREPSTGSLFLPGPMDNFKELYENKSYPIAFMSLPVGENNEYVSGIYWGPLRCIDCVIAGGTKNKPDYWP